MLKTGHRTKYHLRAFEFLAARRRSRAVLTCTLLASFLITMPTGGLQAGDILRGGASAGNAKRNSEARANAGAAAAETAKVRAQDRLARTTKAVNDMRALQASAHAAAAANTIPNGLIEGGLNPIVGGTWTGANPATASGNNVNITQTAPQALLQWRTFNVGSQTTLNFDQSAGGADSGKWIAFNKVFDPDAKPSEIHGKINAQGQIYVINQNGIIFGAGSQVNARTLVASSLPINDNFIKNGLLTQPKNQDNYLTEFLFSAVTDGTFTPPEGPDTGKYGDVIVQRGAILEASLNADGGGGRIVLVGANVHNAGEIRTSSGQTILAAGLQVGFQEHSSADPSLRGLDAFVGQVDSYAGLVENSGLISIPTGSLLMAGKNLIHSGVTDSLTSVSLNGRIDLLASYNAVRNADYNPISAPNQPSFINRSTGNIDITSDSTLRLIPDYQSPKTTVGTRIPIRSRVNILGKNITVGPSATILANNGEINVQAGDWRSVIEVDVEGKLAYRRGEPHFVFADGNVNLGSNSLLDSSGSTDVFLPISQNLVEVQLRGSELAISPTQRDGAIRGLTMVIDLRKSGYYNGRYWMGTPLGDATGFANIIERTAEQLTTNGGQITIKSGGSLVAEPGSMIDVSGGYFRNEKGRIATSKLLVDGRTLVDVSEAEPDRIYTGLFSNSARQQSGKWGVAKTFQKALAPTGAYEQGDFITGADGGALAITSPLMMLQGDLLGNTIQGPRQIRKTQTSSSIPLLSKLSLNFTNQSPLSFTGKIYPIVSPTPPDVSFSRGLGGLAASRDLVTFGETFFSSTGFGSLEIENAEGELTVMNGVNLSIPVGGSLKANAKNIQVEGQLFAPSGTISLTAYAFSPYQAEILKAPGTNAAPSFNTKDGTIVLGASSVLSTAGLINDDRFPEDNLSPAPVGLNGGQVNLRSFNLTAQAGSLIDVSGGAIVPASGKVKYGNAGEISLSAGNDPSSPSLLGGSLSLAGRIEGFAAYGKQGGILRLTAPLIQIGGSPLHSSTFLLSPEFFSQGGFSDFKLSGLGSYPDANKFNELRNTAGDADAPDSYLPAVFIASGVEINPKPIKRSLVSNATSTNSEWKQISLREELTPSVSISLMASGVKEEFTTTDSRNAVIERRFGDLKIRGDIYVSAGSAIMLQPESKLSLTGQTISFLGRANVPGGSISLTADKEFPTTELNPEFARPTLYLGQSAELLAKGGFKKLADPYKRVRGKVFDGGKIDLTGNIYTAKGSLMDVSGSRATVDLTAAERGFTSFVPQLIDPSPNLLPSSLQTSPTLVESNGGSIRLIGKQMLVNEATMIGRSGGDSSLGGALQISSGRFYKKTDTSTSADLNLVVAQSQFLNLSSRATQGIGFPIILADDSTLTGGGFFSIDQTSASKFSSLKLGGNIEFRGDVSIKTSSSLDIADGGIISAAGNVRLESPYVKLGQPFRAPLLPTDEKILFSNSDPEKPIYTFAPTFGAGSFEVLAKNIDIGTLSLSEIGQAKLTAESGGIRGNGVFQMAGALQLAAAAIYPTTANSFSLFVYDAPNSKGRLALLTSGAMQTPLSAGGSLIVQASIIEQGGALLAPFGQIQLGWDGRGLAPENLIAGSTLSCPITQSLSLLPASMTSVAGLNYRSGQELTIPYGVTFDGLSWIDPAGQDITDGKLLPKKSISVSAKNIIAKEGSTIDIRGGGDLLAYQWVEGNGGPIDILSPSPRYKDEIYSYGSAPSYAILPDYDGVLIPYAPFNASSKATKLDNASGVHDTGYVHENLTAGQQVYLEASKNLSAGYYTLLPARYALLGGAFLVTPMSGTVQRSSLNGDGSETVPGYSTNRLATFSTENKPRTMWEITPSDVLASRAEYKLFKANTFFPKRSAELGLSETTRLPLDSGHLNVGVISGLRFAANILAPSVGPGLGAYADFYSQAEMFIGNSDTSKFFNSVLNSNRLSSYGIESLVIGGQRSGSSITPITTRVVIQNSGSNLDVSDLILTSKQSMEFAKGSSIRAINRSTATTEEFSLSGNGPAMRISSSGTAKIARPSSTSSQASLISIEDGVVFQGDSLTLDSTSGFEMNPGASLIAKNISLGANQISIFLNGNPSNSGEVDPLNPHLILANTSLKKLLESDSISLTSYQSSVDFHGSGVFGSSKLSSLNIQAGSIRGFSRPGSSTILSAKLLSLSNPNSATPLLNSAKIGNLELRGMQMRIGSGITSILNFENTLVSAPQGIFFDGFGKLSTESNLRISTAQIAAAQAAKHGVYSAGTLFLDKVSSQSVVSSGLGAFLTFEGSNVKASTDIKLPSGFLSFISKGLTGDLSISGSIDVSGFEQNFFELTRLSDAGQINLSSNHGNVEILADAKLVASAPKLGGNAGTIKINAPNGNFINSGILTALAGNGGSGGSFEMVSGALPSFDSLLSTLQTGGFTESQKIRLTTGDARIATNMTAREIRVSTDSGGIRVESKLDASGLTGGSISLLASKSIELAETALLDARGLHYSNAGKGGQIHLEAGSSINGISDSSAFINIAKGSRIELGVNDYVPGNSQKLGSSAFKGQFNGTLHIRAPRTGLGAGTGIGIGQIDGTVIGASSILAEGFKVYTTTQTITSAIQNQINTESITYLGSAGSSSLNYRTIMASLLTSNPNLESIFVLAPGAEITNTSGDLVLGTSSSTSTSDWNLSTFRYGPKNAPGVLTLRAKGDLIFYNALSDGFSPTRTNTSGHWLWLAPLSEIASSAEGSTPLPLNTQSWSYRFSAGNDVSAADYRNIALSSELSSKYGGSVRVGKNYDQAIFGSGTNLLTSTALNNRFQVIRTGTGDIDVSAAKDITLLNQFASIYTAGVRLADYQTIFSSGDFSVPLIIDSLSQGDLGAAQRNSNFSYPVQYTMAGGSIRLSAGDELNRLTGANIADSSRQLPSNWLYRRGFVDSATGEYGIGGYRSGIQNIDANPASTTWWIDYSNFFAGIGALGGGDILLEAGGNIENFDAAIPTNARAPMGKADSSKIHEIGGGDLLVLAGGDIDAGIYYVERGQGTLKAKGAIVTNATRSPSLGIVDSMTTPKLEDALSWLPTTVFVGKSKFQVQAQQDILLGPATSAFLLPQGTNNRYWNKSYFATFQPTSSLTVSSLGGTITHRLEAQLPNENAPRPILGLWADQQQKLSSTSSSYYHPWLRLAETAPNYLDPLLDVQAPNLISTSYSGDINIGGDMNLFPSSTGTIELLAHGQINAFQPLGNSALTIPNKITRLWKSSTINISDASPSSLPNPTNPYSATASIGRLRTSLQSTIPGIFTPFREKFEENGSFKGTYAGTPYQKNLHDSSILHKFDTQPARFYAANGNIEGLSLFSPKSTRIIASADIADVAFYIQNASEKDFSIVAAGRDILPYNSSGSLRSLASELGNKEVAGPLSGDIQIAGPGVLEVLAGRHIDLGTGGLNDDGTGAGISSIGFLRNPALPSQGAELMVLAGIGPSFGLSNSSLNINAFLQKYSSSSPIVDSSEANALRALNILFKILRDSAVTAAKTGSYVEGTEAIKTLFTSGGGRILTQSRDIVTRSGGQLSVLAPYGDISIATTIKDLSLTPPGILTEYGGSVQILANGNVDIGKGRIFTLRGGDITIWSSKGDIAAGTSAKTVVSAPPTRVIVDVESAVVNTDLAGLATGGGIGVLAAVADVPPGDVFLIAPQGVVDAGDAGIRATGDLTIAATAVLNADNISISGSSAGVPSTVAPAAPSVSGLTSGSSTAATNAAAGSVSQQSQQPPNAMEDTPSFISVEILGYGGGDGESQGESEG